MKKSISINLQGLLFHVEEDGYEILRRYLTEVKQHFSAYAGHEEIVADIESRIAELFAARLERGKQVLTLDDVLAVTAQLGRVSEFELPADDDDDAFDRTAKAAGPSPHHAFGGTRAATADAPTGEPAEPRRLFRDETNKKIAGVAAGLGHYFNTNPLWFRLAFVFTALLNSDLLGNLDRHLHINFGGIAVMTYIVLWAIMPKRQGLPVAGDVDTRGPGAGRKLFRDTQTGSLGGVAAGLAWYLKLDITLVRALFVVLTLVGGGGLVLYLILWVVVPEARTLSEQLEMRGEDVTIANIASTASADPIGAGRARVVQNNLSSIGTSLAPVLTFVFTVVGWVAGLIMLAISLALLVAVGAVLGVVLGAFPAVDWVHTGDIPVGLLRNTLPTWVLVAGFVMFLIPTIALLLAAVRLFLKRAVLPTSARLTLFGVWLIALLGVAAGFGRLKNDFRQRVTVSTVQELGVPDGPVVVLDALDNEESELLEPEQLTVVAADSGQPLRLTVRVQAHGSTDDDARQAAAGVEYQAQRTDSVLTLPRTFRLKSDIAWRKQSIGLRLALPTAGVRYRLTDSFARMLNDEQVFNADYRYDDHLAQRLFTIENGRFVLVSGPPSAAADADGADEAAADADDDTEADFDINVNGERIRIDLGSADPSGFRLKAPAGAARRNWDVADFANLEVNGNYQVRVRKGTAFRVTGYGTQKDLDEASVRVSDNKLVLAPKDELRFSLWGRRADRAPLLFEVEMPELSGAEFNGAVRADIGDFGAANEEISLDQSGATWVKLAVTTTPVRLDVSGASHTLLTGSTRQLNVDLSGASNLQAYQLLAREVVLDASGASQARVNATHQLRAEASGAARITYQGSPTTLDTDHSGAASIKRARRDEPAAQPGEEASSRGFRNLAPPTAPAKPAEPAKPGSVSSTTTPGAPAAARPTTPTTPLAQKRILST